MGFPHSRANKSNQIFVDVVFKAAGPNLVLLYELYLYSSVTSMLHCPILSSVSHTDKYLHQICV